MHAKQVLVAVDTPILVARTKEALKGFDVDIHIGDTTSVEKMLFEYQMDLLIADLSRKPKEFTGAGTLETKLEQIVRWLERERGTALLIYVSSEDLEMLRVPIQVSADFVLTDATEPEIRARIKNLLWPGEEASTADILYEGPVSINLATYQVKLDGEPLDLTYMEYTLLSFFMTHPGKTYSREVLLKRVWGLDYLGGSRTVDVHVRRLRSKLGPEVSSKLETVRGFGYLWNA